MFGEFLESLTAKGRFCFDIPELANASGKSEGAVRNALHRLKSAGKVAMPVRGFYVYLPPEYRALGCLPPDQFIPQLMERAKEPYYAALLSAALYHGAAHQQPQEFQVIVAKPRKPIRCGKVRVRFVVRHNVEEMPVIMRNTQRGQIRVSSPETTAFDLAGYPKPVGGLSSAATVIAALAEKLDPKLLAEAAKLSPIAWAQRLGYILEFVKAKGKAKGLAEYVDENKPVPSALIAGKSIKGAEKNSRWRLYMNGSLEVDFDT